MSTVIRTLMEATFTKEASRSFGVTLSTAGVDREKDRLMVTGWKIPRHVPLLWGHDPSALPIGRVANVSVMGDTLRGRIEFPPPGTYEFADTVVRLIDTGYLGSVSVGFRAVDQPQRNELGGFDFPGAKDLIELSVVNCPANTSAHIDGRQTAAMTKWLTDDTDVLALDDEPSVGRSSARFAKAGARHSAADMALLSTIHSAVRDLGSPCEAPDETDVLDLTDVDEEEIAATPHELATAVAAAIRDSVAGLVGHETAKAIARAKGRVWDDPIAGDPYARRHRLVGGSEETGLDRATIDQAIAAALPGIIASSTRALPALIHQELDRRRGRVD